MAVALCKGRRILQDQNAKAASEAQAAMADHRHSSDLLLPTECVTVASSVVGAGASAVGAYYDYKGAKKGEPVIVTPPIDAFSYELQAAAAAELKSLNSPCPRDTVNVSDCSALKRLVIDYGDLRQRIRASKGTE